MSAADKPIPAVFKDLANDHEAIKQILSHLSLAQPGEAITIKALTGGVSSNIFHLTTQHAQYCLKQALPQLKVAKQWLAPVDRVFAEIVVEFIDYAFQKIGTPRGDIPVAAFVGCYAVKVSVISCFNCCNY